MEICDESITITTIANEDLKLEGQHGCVVRVSKGETTEVRMKSTTKFERLMDYFYTRHFLVKGSLAFFFTEKLRPEQCPADVHMKTGDIIYIKNCLKSPKIPKESNSGSNFLADLRKMFMNKILCDVCFQVGNEKIFAHKALLAARCDKFNAMFTNSMIEAKSNVIAIEGYSPESFRVMLEYLYTDKVSDELNFDIYLELLKLSDEYLLNNLTNWCGARLSKYVTVNTVSLILSYADRFNATLLKQFCLSYLVSNYSAVIDTPEFKEHLISRELLYEIMCALQPYIPSKEPQTKTVFNSLI